MVKREVSGMVIMRLNETKAAKKNFLLRLAGLICRNNVRNWDIWKKDPSYRS